ncbi:MAG: hypothetical protein AB1938_02880 [Myxococcota bacterium]
MVRTTLFAALFFVSACGIASGSSTEDQEVNASSRLDAARRLWFAPNVGARDTLRLFQEPDTWSQARDRLGVFQFYAQNLAAMQPSQCATCNDVLMPNLEAVDAFRKLAAWDVAIAFEMGSVKHHTCEGERAAEFGAYVVDQVALRGGSVAFIAMDEPYAGGNMQVGAENCRYTRDQSADQVARFVQRLAERAPGVRVGDIEPYPYFKVGDLMAWVDALRARGVDLAFFHVDIDRNHVKNIRADVFGDLRKLQQFLTERGIPMGVIFQAHELEVPTRSDEQHYDVVLKHAQDTKSRAGTPDHAIVQSWFHVDGQNTVPNNLPFEGKGHTRLLFDVGSVFGFTGMPGPAPTPTPTPTPAPTPTPTPTPVTGDEATVKVAHAYRGILGRDADPGASGWADALRRGQSSAWLCTQLAASDEFRITRGGLGPDELAAELYRGILEREGDEGGLAGTASEIAAGRLGVRAGAMLDSPEFRERFLR